MHSLGKRVSSVQFRVGAPFYCGGHAQASQSSQRSSGFHTPAVPRAALGTATSLRPSSFGVAGLFASKQQPADILCKNIMPGQHRLEAPFFQLA
jgi:hypothetical protein